MTERHARTILSLMRWPGIILKFIAVFAGVVVIALLLLVWRVSSQPMTSTALTPYAVAAIENLLPNTQAEIAHTLIEWDNIDYSIAIHGDNVTLRDSQKAVIAEFPKVKLKLSLWGLLQGRFVPAELQIADPQLWFVRRADGTVWFGGEAAGGGGGAEPSESLYFWDALRHLSAEIAQKGQLRELDITNAVIFVHDEEIAQDRAIKVPQISLRRGWAALTGLAKIEVAQKDHPLLLEARYAYSRSEKLHTVSVLFDAINPALLAELHPRLGVLAAADLPLKGEVDVTTDRDLNIVKMTAKIEGGKGRLVAPSFWDQPRAVEKLKLAGSYDRQAHKMDVPTAEIDFGGPKLALSLKGEQPPAGDKQAFDMAFVMDLRLMDLPMDQYASVWPKPIITNAREWIAESLTKGVFRHGEVTLRGKLAMNDLGNMLLESGEGKISAVNGTVAYMDGMPPVEGVNADAVFDLDHMDVQITGGGIGAIRLQPSTINITDFQTAMQHIVIPVKIAAPVRDVVKLIDAPPLGYAKAAGLRFEDTDGNVEGSLDLRFPLLKALFVKDIDIKANAQLTGFGVKKVAKGIDLSEGNFALTLDMEGFALKGPAMLNKVPLQVDYQSRFSVEKGKPYRLATLNGTVSNEQWGLLGADLSGKVKGPVAVTLRITQPDKTETQLAGEIDLRQAAIQFDDLAWNKAAGTAAALSFAADMPQGKNIRLKNLELQGANVRAKGSGTLDGESFDPLELNVNPLVIGRTNAVLHFTQTPGEKGEMRFSAEGQSFDVSGLTGGKDPGRTDPRPKDYTINVEKLYTSENGFIANLRAHAQRDLQGWNVIELHGLADGGHQLDISLAPKDGRRVFSLTCDDFGKALKGMGFTDTVKDGELAIVGESSLDNPRVIEGEVTIGHFVVAGLPVVARLLSAASPFGIIDFVTGNASFDHLAGKFRWQGDVAELIKVRAAGSVFGLNIDGRVDLNTGDSNLRGTMVPFSLVNRIIGNIPLLGDVITGGDGGGVLAVNYSVKGPLRDPEISVNPVSLLTPGFLRNLFFDGEDDELPSDQAPAGGGVQGKEGVGG